MRSGFQDTTLIVFGHGSSQYPVAGSSVLEHTARLRNLNRFAEVRAAFWKQEPRLDHVLAAAAGSRAFVVPLFMSEGYFSDVIVPKALGLTPHRPATPGHEPFCISAFPRVQEVGGRTLGYCRPVGTHPGVTEIVLGRAREVTDQFPFPVRANLSGATLFIAGHGTNQNDNSRQAIDAQTDQIRSRNVFAAVHAVFLEETPKIEEVYALAQTRNVVVVPFFAGEGGHVTEDIPALLGEPRERIRQRLGEGLPTWRNPTERQGKRVWYSASVGSHAQVVEIILDRVSELSGLAPQTA